MSWREENFSSKLLRLSTRDVKAFPKGPDFDASGHAESNRKTGMWSTTDRPVLVLVRGENWVRFEVSTDVLYPLCASPSAIVFVRTAWPPTYGQYARVEIKMFM